MFHKRFIDALFSPQPLYSKKALRTVFDRLAHASIMRLNAASMDKVSYIVLNNSHTTCFTQSILSLLSKSLLFTWESKTVVGPEHFKYHKPIPALLTNLFEVKVCRHQRTWRQLWNEALCKGYVLYVHIVYSSLTMTSF